MYVPTKSVLDLHESSSRRLASLLKLLSVLGEMKNENLTWPKDSAASDRSGDCVLAATMFYGR